jgi:hypothetical protein
MHRDIIGLSDDMIGRCDVVRDRAINIDKYFITNFLVIVNQMGQFQNISTFISPWLSQVFILSHKN